MATKINTIIDTHTIDESSESTPLIGNKTNDSTKQNRSQLITCLTIVAVITLAQGGDQLADSPLTRLIESVSCYRYYEQHDPSRLLTTPDLAGPGAIYGVDEILCKVNSVQAQVANIRSYQNLWDGIPALLLAVPMSWLQDRYGRRPFLILAMFSYILRAFWLLVVLWYWQSFDLRWLWFSSVHALLMGGSSVTSALVFTMIADITTSAQRATYLSRMGAGALLTTFIVPPISAWLMAWNPWIPAGIGALFTTAGALLTFTVPETLDFHPADDEDDATVPQDERDTNGEVVPTIPQRLWQTMKTEASCLWEDKRVPAIIAPFIVHILLLQTTQLLVQYASKRYHFMVAEATVLVTVKAGVLVLVLFFLLPEVSRILMQWYGISSKYKDLLITRGSFFIMIIGWIVVGIAPVSWLFIIGLITTSLGTGAIVTLRSLLTALVRRDQVARVFSVVCVVDTLGMMFGSVLLAKCFDLGMQSGGIGIGLPFFVLAAVCCFFLLMLSAFVQLRKDERGVIDLIVVEDVL